MNTVHRKKKRASGSQTYEKMLNLVDKKNAIKIN